MDKKINLFCVIVNETENIINLNVELETGIKNLENCELRGLTNQLRDASKIIRTNNGSPKKITASEGVFNYLDEWLKLLVNKLQKDDIEVLEPITDIFRFLRNCSSDFRTQQYILEKTIILNNVDDLFSKITEIDLNNICLKIVLQFLINLVCSNKEAGEKIFKLFYDRVKKCLQAKINTYESSALIYYISLMRSINDVELTRTVLELCYNNLENEFLIFFLENKVSYSNFWKIYQDIPTEFQIIILETLKNMQLQKKSYNLPLNAQGMLIEEFLTLAGTVFCILEKEENKLKAYKVSLLLEILSSLSSDENYLKELQRNRSVLINAGVLLINIHKLGKESDNCFTPIQKLTEFKVNSGLNEHPAFGFKADLIRLIGNLCWKNMDLQDLARTADLIPVILDCCNMDARNPFIIQWSILALRNLCENNQENQRIIASLHQEGTINSEVLDDMGLTLHSDKDSELKIIPLECLKKD